MTIKENCEEKISGSLLFWCKPFLSQEAILSDGSPSFHTKPWFLVGGVPFTETVPFNRSHSFWWKPLRSYAFIETITLSENRVPFSGSDSFLQPFLSWKPFFLVENISLSKSHSFYWEPFLLVAISRSVGTIPPSGCHSFHQKQF